MLVGRDDERRSIDELLEATRSGKGGALALHGEPGIGKSSLLAYAAGRCQGLTLVEVRAAEAEASLPFAALVDLLTPLLDSLERLPGRQADALRSALAVGPAHDVDRLALQVGAFNLLCAAAESTPVVALVDDAHWMDAASADAIGFAARRIGADPVAILIATRSSGLEGIRSIGVGPLAPDAARDLLERSGADPSTVEGTLRTAAGNPLALLEIAGSGDAGERTLEEAYARTAAGLREDTRHALLLLAAGGASSGLVVARALAAEGLTTAAFEEAEAAAMVTIDAGRTEFRHPLIRSAVYGSAPAAERRAAHAALAASCVEDDLRWDRVAHLAAAAMEPNEDLAGSVDQLAGNVRSRGGAAAAAEWYERAARLSTERGPRLRRLLAGAEAAQLAGRSEQAVRLLEEAERETGDATERALVELQRGRIDARSGSTLVAGDRFLRAARTVEEEAPELAASLYIESIDPSIRAGRPAEALAAATRAGELSGGTGSAGLMARIAQAASLVFMGDAAQAAIAIDEAADAVERSPELSSDFQLRAYLALVLAFAERAAAAGAILDDLIDACEHDAPGSLTYPLISRSWVRRSTGRWEDARADALRAVRIARQLGRSSDECWGLSVLTWIDAAQGRLDGDLLDRQETLAAQLDLPYQAMCAHAARGIHALGAGQPGDAAGHLAEALDIKRRCGMADATTQPVLGADLVEALMRAGRREDAVKVAAELREGAERAGRPSAMALALRAAALVEEDWRPPMELAWDLHREAGDAFGSARTALAYGEALRRGGSRVEAREMLERAAAELGRLGARPWLEQAEAGLGRSARVLRKDAAARDELTPAETQVASLAAEGKTNREIAGSLWMSEKTVEAHLSRVYRKTGVRNRSELAARHAALRAPEAAVDD